MQFSGAVTRCSKFNHGEFLLLLGDAAHSVIPPTGEGVNSGLEDTRYLAEAFETDPTTPFATYNALRCAGACEHSTVWRHDCDPPGTEKKTFRLLRFLTGFILFSLSYGLLKLRGKVVQRPHPNFVSPLRGRTADLRELGEYAWHLMEDLRGADPAKKAASVMYRIASGTAYVEFFCVHTQGLKSNLLLM